MTTDLEAAVGLMADDLLTINGQAVSYLRDGVEAGTPTMSKQRQPAQYIDNGNGGFIEVVPVDFVCKTADLPFNPPLRGDQIVVDGEIFEVLPTTGEKVYRVISSQMTRIHTKQVSGS